MSEKGFAPPPRRVVSTPPTAPPTPEGWRGKFAAKSKVWGHKAADKAVVISDNVGGKVNRFSEKRFGTEAFWPTTGDLPKEMDKAARILRAFTEQGIVTRTDKKSKIKLLRKIPPSVIANAKGLAIFTSMRTGIAPLGGAGGAGIVVAKLPDGSWSAPASISPNNMSAGFLLGVDIYDCVLVIRSQKALDSFGTHKFTLGTEIAVVAGPWGAGAAIEAGKEAAPVFSYVKSRGLWAGVEVVGQVFVERYEENAAMYHWPGVKAKEILAGKVAVPPEAASLMAALKDAESGRAQSRTLGGALECPVDSNGVPLGDSTQAATIDLHDGEVLKLPPTPDMTDGHEGESEPETEVVIRRSGLNPPPLPERRSHTAPPLPARRPDPPAYEDIADGPSDAYPADKKTHTVDLETYPVDSKALYDAPEGPPPAPPATQYDAPEGPPPGPSSALYDVPLSPPPAASSVLYDAPEGPPPATSAMQYEAPDHPPPPHLAQEPPALITDAPPPIPKRSEKRMSTMSPTSPVTPTSPVNHAVVTPMTLDKRRPTTPELVALGAPADMDEGERREWEQHWLQTSAVNAKGKGKAVVEEDESLL